MNILNLPTKEQFDTQNLLLTALVTGEVPSHVDGLSIKSWRDMQRVVRMGLAGKIFRISDQLIANVDNVPLVCNVIGIDHDTPADPRFEHSLTLQFQDCLRNEQVSNYQALYYAEEELPAGEYVFTFNDLKYKFITTKAVPIGGQVCISTWGTETYVPTKIVTYEENRTTTIESGLDVMPIASGEDTLMPVHYYGRCRYGSNNYVESAIRQWLNDDTDAFKWIPQTNYDRPSTYTTKGFLKLIDPELAAVLGAVNKQVARNTITDGGGQDTFSDKVFLLSRVEVGLGTEGTTTGEKVYPYYDGITNAGRIKLLSGSPRSWWLRSPHVSYSITVRLVTTSGALDNYLAVNAHGLSPACVII